MIASIGSNQTIGIKKLFLVILIFSFSIQFLAYNLFKAFEPRFYPKDIPYYDSVAKDLLEGKGLEIKRFPPGYSFYLAFLYKITGTYNYKSPYIHISSLLLLALTVGFCFVIFSKLFDIKIGLASSLLFTIYPLFLFLSTRPGLSEHLFFFVFYIALLIFVLGITKRSYLIIFLSGLFFGYASLTRYVSLLYPVIIFVYISTDKTIRTSQKLLFMMVFLFGYTLILIPWLLYIGYKESNEFSIYLISIAKKSFRPYKEFVIAKIINDSNIESSIEFLKFLLKTIAEHPVSFFIIFCRKLMRSWYFTSKRWYHTQIILIQVPIIMSAIWGVFVNLSNNIYRRSMLLCLLSILYFWFITAMTTNIFRIMIICMPFVFAFSALGIFSIYKRIDSKSDFT